MKKIFIILIFIFFTKIVKCSLCGFEDWIEFKDEKCFKYVNRVVGHDEAERTCKDQAKGGPTLNFLPTLVSIKSQEEQDFLERYLFEKSGVLNNVWIGAKRKTDNETKFEWNDGSELEYNNWDDGYPTSNTDRKCVHMQPEDNFKNFTDLVKSSTKGKWLDVNCDRKNSVACEKLQMWSFPRLQKTLLAVRKELSDTRNQLNDTRNQLLNTANQLSDTRNELIDTRHELGRTNQRFEGIEGAFMSSFEVGGSENYYYPVAFKVHDQTGDRSNPRTPLMYDIYRSYNEKAPASLNIIGLTLKLMCGEGSIGWSAGSNTFKVFLHHWMYNKGVANVQLFYYQESRLFVWLRGGGVLYHIRSPIDLNQKITIYLEYNAVAAPAVIGSNGAFNPAIVVNPIAVGSEDPNLVKTGAYDGWGF